MRTDIKPDFTHTNNAHVPALIHSLDWARRFRHCWNKYKSLNDEQQAIAEGKLYGRVFRQSDHFSKLIDIRSARVYLRHKEKRSR